jgi:hypothetical protein
MPNPSSLANLKPPWTTETARAAAARSNAAQAATRAARPKPAPGRTDIPSPDDDYPATVLMRTRTQLDLVAQRILDELDCKIPDSRRLRDLSDAQRHLAEQERILAGRPLPGSRRPAAEGKRTGSVPGPSSGPWIPAAPAPQPPTASALPLGWEYDPPASDTPTGSVP